MAKQDPEVVRAFKELGMRHIREQLLAAEGHFVDKAAAYDAVVAAFKAEYGWPPALTELEHTVGGKLREVYINRLHWMTARLCRDGVIESVTNRPFIALAGHLAAAEAAYGLDGPKRGPGRPRSPKLTKTAVHADSYQSFSEQYRQQRADMPNRPAKQIVEQVLGPARTRALWTANYYPGLPFTPQSFEIGALLPTMLYMARFGHRRGKGRFAETFGRARTGGKADAVTVASVADVLAEASDSSIEGFGDEIGRIMLGDLLLSWCFENRNHSEGQEEQILRVLPTHYFSSWIDLPDNIANLRGVPELLTAILAAQPQGDVLQASCKSVFPIGVNSHSESPLLALFGRHCEIRGQHAADFAADRFVESSAGDIGIDELLAIRAARCCGHAPVCARGESQIPNRMPVATRASDLLRVDLATFIGRFGPIVPRQAFLQMFEAGIGVGLVNLMLSTARVLIEWEHHGRLPADGDQTPWPVFVDASQGQNATLREFSESSMSECLRRFERVPIIMMLLRLLDDRVRKDRRLADQVPQSVPDPSRFLELLGEVYKERHPRSEWILQSIFDDAKDLAEQFAGDEADLASWLHKGTAWDLAESLCELMGRRLQMAKYLVAIDGALLTDKPNGLAVRRRVSRTIDGRRRTIDVRSVVLSSALLDFLVHRHLYDSPDATAPRALSLQQFLALCCVSGTACTLTASRPARRYRASCCGRTRRGWSGGCATWGS
jgi:hypothetical protein